MSTANMVAAGSDVILLLTMIVFGFQAREMAKQSRAAAAATRASVYQTIAQQMQEIDKFFVTQPTLRPYIYDGAPVPTGEPLRTQVMALAELFVDFFDNFVTQSGQIPTELYEPWRRYAAFVMESSPAVCAFWNENRDWYSELLKEMLDSSVSPSSDRATQEEAAREWAEAGDLGEAPSPA